MEEVKSMIRKATEDSNEVNPYVLKCIEKVKEHDFHADEEDVKNLMTIVKNMDGATTMSTTSILQLIADVAKFEGNRPLFTDETLMSKLIEYLMCDMPDVCLQSVRSLANICADNTDACELFMKLGGVDKIVAKAEDIATSDEKLWNQITPNACACMRNMITSNEKLQQKFLENNTLTILWRYVEKYYASDPIIATYAISGIESLTDSENGLKKLEESKIMYNVCHLMEKWNDDLLKVLFQEMLTGYGSQENTRIMLCKCGYIGTLCKLIEERTNFKETKCTDDILKEMADLVVMLSSGEESFVVLQESEKDFLNQISNWIASPNTHIQVSAGLILGNYARSEETCNEIVAKKIHENLINVMKEHLNGDLHDDGTDNKFFYDRLQSYASCLRNLTIPVENKTLLIEAGLHLLAVDLVKKPSLGVQFKGLGIIRLLVQGNAEITTVLMADVEFISKICELSEVSCVSSVPSEAQRLMAALLKFNSNEETLRHAISLDAFKPVLSLLSSEHTLMQNEGLVGLIITIANVSDCLPQLTENEAVQKVLKLMTGPGVQTQTLFNCITFLQAISSLDGGLECLKSLEVGNVLESIRNNTEEIIRNKVVETLALIN